MIMLKEKGGGKKKVNPRDSKPEIGSFAAAAPVFIIQFL